MLVALYSNTTLYQIYLDLKKLTIQLVEKEFSRLWKNIKWYQGYKNTSIKFDKGNSLYYNKVVFIVMLSILTEDVHKETLTHP